MKESQEKYQGFVEFENMGSISPSEFKELHVEPSTWFKAIDNVECKLAWALSLFRMRLRLAQEIDALVVIGGKTSDGWGRFPGVVEEVMLALAFQGPVYVLGMATGEDKSVGAAKPSGIHWDFPESTTLVAEFLPDPAGANSASFREMLRLWSACFEVPAKPGLPMTFKKLRRFLREHAIGTTKWPENGLTSKENRKLFDAGNNLTDRELCVDLIVKGISRLRKEELWQ